MRILSCALAILTWTLPASAQSLLTSWDGGANTDARVPPDPHGAAGPAGIVGTYNVSVTYYGKSGNIIWGPTNLGNFFASAGNTGQGLADPKVLYDRASQRFFLVHQENTTANRSFLNIAASRNSDPRSTTTADWAKYRVEMTEYSGGQTNGGDYPGFGLDSQAVYVSYNMFGMTNGNIGGGSLNSQLFIFNKADLVAGQTMSFSSMDLNGSSLQPATPVDSSSPGNRVYLIQSLNRTNLQLWAVDDPLGAATVNSTVVTIPDNGGGATNRAAPQSGVANVVDTMDTRAQAAIYQDGNIWTALTAGPAGGPSQVYYYRINPVGFPSGFLIVTESGAVGDAGFWNYQPAIGGNFSGDIALVYTRSSTTANPAMMYVYRNAGDDTFGSPQVVANSGGPSVTTASRWGDYAAVSADPADGSLWITSEYARNSSQNNWGTWFAQIGTPARDVYVNWNSPNPTVQDGSLAFPYTTVGAAQANITRGTLHIFGGNYNEQLTLNKAITLEAFSGGPVTIGAP